MKAIIYMFVFILMLVSCKQDTTVTKLETSSPSKNELKLPDWAKSANIYEVNIRQYTPEGTFVAFSKHLPRLKAMGVDILWLMPIFPISNTKKKGTLGSYYAVSDFKATNPEFGTLEDFKNLLDKAHAMGMKVILDWVPNHTGWDHVWIEQHPDYFTQDKDGIIVDPIDPATGKSWGWTDVADLNYYNKSMRKEMIDDMLYWVNDIRIDGFRMDVAHGVPNDFWRESSNALLTKNDSLFLLAESENIDQANEGYFHMLYGWAQHHMMNQIAKGEKNADDFHNLITQKNDELKQGIFMNFTSNHDENSWAGTTEERMGAGHDAFAVVAATFDGMPLIYGGQEEPLKRRLEFFEKDDIAFAKYEKQKFYQTLLGLKHRNKALWNGPHGGKLVRVGQSPHIYGYMREKDGDKVAVLVNLSNEKREIRIDTPLLDMTEIFTGSPVQMGPGTIKSMDPWEYWVASNR